MNRAVVIRTTAGVCRYLSEIVGDAPRLVVGHDARRGSAVFAQDVAAVATAAGAVVSVLPEALPTPVLGFAIRRLGADAAIMITASHNPADDNGYKVYLGGRASDEPGRGVQIVPPADEGIAAAIALSPPADEVPRADHGWALLGGDIVAEYVAAVADGDQTGPADEATPPEGADDRGPVGAGPQRAAIKIVLTPLHGVGGRICLAALNTAGFTNVTLVPEQADPDPGFPTVEFPNPEEPGALDLATALARRIGADLVIATDPDADRCSAAIPDPDDPSGYRQLTGDEIGGLLGEQAARRTVREHVTPEQRPAPVLASSIVSSRLLERIASAYQLSHRITLTGFKWIARSPGLVFGYEEANGYCCDPDVVRDKDGISAAARLAALVAQLKSEGRTLADELDDQARRYGLYATKQTSFRVDDLSKIRAAMRRLRHHSPTHLAGHPVICSIDLLHSDKRTGAVEELPDDVAALPPTDALIFINAANERVVVRPSGTEPKLKCYLETVTEVPPGAPVPRADADHRLELLAADITDILALDRPDRDDDSDADRSVPSDTELLDLARTAAARAYVPYSRFPVGAAVLTASGRAVLGCNVENASFGLTTCAEHAAITHMVVTSHADLGSADQQIVTVAVVGQRTAPCLPCGACRQVLMEFGCRTVVVEEDGRPVRHELSDLLQHAFGPDTLSPHQTRRDPTRRAVEHRRG